MLSCSLIALLFGERAGSITPENKDRVYSLSDYYIWFAVLGAETRTAKSAFVRNNTHFGRGVIIFFEWMNDRTPKYMLKNAHENNQQFRLLCWTATVLIVEMHWNEMIVTMCQKRKMCLLNKFLFGINSLILILSYFSKTITLSI